MSTICTDTCLEMLSSLVNCSVDNVRSEIGPSAYLAQLQSFKSVKDSEWTKRKMLIFCTLLIFALILWHLTDICWIDDKKSHLKHVLWAWKVQNFWVCVYQGNAATYLRCSGQPNMNFVGNLPVFTAVKEFCRWSRIDKVVAMVRVSPFFDSQCIYIYIFIYIYNLII